MSNPVFNYSGASMSMYPEVGDPGLANVLAQLFRIAYEENGDFYETGAPEESTAQVAQGSVQVKSVPQLRAKAGYLNNLPIQRLIPNGGINPGYRPQSGAPGNPFKSKILPFRPNPNPSSPGIVNIVDTPPSTDPLKTLSHAMGRWHQQDPWPVMVVNNLANMNPDFADRSLTWGEVMWSLEYIRHVGQAYRTPLAATADFVGTSQSADVNISSFVTRVEGSTRSTITESLFKVILLGFSNTALNGRSQSPILVRISYYIMGRPEPYTVEWQYRTLSNTIDGSVMLTVHEMVYDRVYDRIGVIDANRPLRVELVQAPTGTQMTVRVPGYDDIMLSHLPKAIG